MKIKSSIERLIPYESKQVDVPVVLNANETTNYLFPDGFPLFMAFAKYPNTNADDLRQALADKYQLRKDNFIIGNGSTNLLEITMKTFTEPGDIVMAFDPSFAMYDIYSQIHNVSLIKVDAEEDMSQDIDKMIAMAKRYDPSIIFLCSPNNPTGVMNTKEDVLRLVENTNALVIVDEAYMDFAMESESVIPNVEEHYNLIVARTFSKAYGLAALRLGYMVANENLIYTLLKVKLPYSVNSVSVMIGLEALQQQDKVQDFLLEMIDRRETLYQELSKLPLTVYPSSGNFLFVKSPKELQEPLLDSGILIRSFGNGRYRITIGTTEENQAVLAAIKEVLS